MPSVNVIQNLMSLRVDCFLAPFSTCSASWMESNRRELVLWKELHDLRLEGVRCPPFA